MARRRNKQDIMILGDLHGSLMCARVAIRLAHERDIRTIIQVGDFGFEWQRMGTDTVDLITELDDYLRQHQITMYAIRGNHDPVELAAEGWNRGWHNICYQPDGSSRVIGDVTVGFLGGAVSVDRHWRKEGVTMWKQFESAKQADAKKLPACDVLIAHDAPELPPLDRLPGIRISDELKPELYDSRYAVKVGLEISGAAKLFSGHYHLSMSKQLTIKDKAVQWELLAENQAPGWIRVVDKDFNVRETL